MEVDYSFAGLVLIVNALVEVVKRTPLHERVEKWYPFLVEAVGFALGLATGYNWFESLLIGLSAMGIYDTAKTALDSRK